MRDKNKSSFKRDFTCALLRIFAAKGQQRSAMATPIGRNIGEILETMRNTVVNFLLVGISLVVGLADAFRDHFGITLPMASVLAILTLHTSSVFQEIATKSTTHDVVELLRDKFVTLLLMNLFLSLADGALSIKTDIEGSAIFQLFGYQTLVLYSRCK
jgi:hypothetical protein